MTRARSIGSVGDSYDNALAESVIGLYKRDASVTTARSAPSTNSNSPP